MKLDKIQLLKRPNYLLTRYQNEIYRQLIDYMEKNNLTQKEIANTLNVSNSYVSQVLNGNFNFTLKKLIELALMIGKVPFIEFISPQEFWERSNKSYMVEMNRSRQAFFGNREYREVLPIDEPRTSVDPKNNFEVTRSIPMQV